MHTWRAVFVEMEVDEAPGRARMRRCVAGYSAGRIINPRTARSQMIGGIIWGYGRAMLEESTMDRRYGRFLSKNLSGVMVSVNADIPRDIDIVEAQRSLHPIWVFPFRGRRINTMNNSRSRPTRRGIAVSSRP